MKKRHLTNFQLQSYIEKTPTHGNDIIENHIHECGDCGRHLSAYQAVDDFFDEMLPECTSPEYLDRIVIGAAQRFRRHDKKMKILQIGAGLSLIFAGVIYSQYKYRIWGNFFKTLREIWNGFLSDKIHYLDVPVFLVITILFILTFAEKRLHRKS